MNPIRFSETALVVIDLQKGIVNFPLSPRSGADVVQNAARLAERFRAAGAPVVLVHVAFSPDGGDALKAEVDQPFKPRGLSEDWWKFVPEMGPQPNDIVILKRQWGAFYGTELDLQLRRRGVRKIVLCGISTNAGVESTARAGHEHGYELVLVEDAMASSVGHSAHEFSVTQIMPRLGVVRSTDEVLAACE